MRVTASIGVERDGREVDARLVGEYEPGEKPCDGMRWRQTGHGPQPSPGCDARAELVSSSVPLSAEDTERAVEALLEAGRGE